MTCRPSPCVDTPATLDSGPNLTPGNSGVPEVLPADRLTTPVRAASASLTSQRCEGPTRRSTPPASLGAVGESLCVATFNIRNGLAFDGWQSWPFRRRRTLAAIAGLRADVVGLQEAHGFQRRWLAKRLALSVVGIGRSGHLRNESCPILFRGALTLRSSSTRWISHTPERPGSRLGGEGHPRVFTVAELEWNGRTVVMANSHFSARSDDRRRQAAQQVAEWLTLDRPTVLMGDFNAPASDPIFAVLLSGGLRLVPPDPAGGTFHRFRGTADGAAIDHILVSRHWEVATCSIVGPPMASRRASDHWPVRAELSLADG